MKPSNVERLKTKILLCTDPTASARRRFKAARDIRDHFQPVDHIEDYGEIARMPDLPKEAAVIVLAAIYVCGRKHISPAAAIEELATTVHADYLPMELRTQAFQLLLRLDVEAAALAAQRSMPAMMCLVDAQREYPTQHVFDASGERFPTPRMFDPSKLEESYAEALSKFLFF